MGAELGCGGVVGALNGWVPEDFGTLEICFTAGTRKSCAEVLFAEVCEVEEEFVPEPGTVALLASGLAGLAGYATLRWRTRE
jgi:hypothetical protein